jgi:hypothetical protein
MVFRITCFHTQVQSVTLRIQSRNAVLFRERKLAAGFLAVKRIYIYIYIYVCVCVCVCVCDSSRRGSGWAGTEVLRTVNSTLRSYGS